MGLVDEDVINAIGSDTRQQGSVINYFLNLPKHRIEAWIRIASKIKQHNFVRLREPKYGSTSKAFSDKELEVFLNNCKFAKAKLAFKLMAFLGLRVGEVVNIKISDIDTKRHLLKIHTEKAHTLDELYLHDKIRHDIYEWMAKYQHRIKKHEGYLLFSDIAGRVNISPDWLRNEFRRTAIKSGINDNYGMSTESIPNRKQRVLYRLTTHSLRHYFITRVYRNTKNPIHTQKLARHKEFGSTQVYIRSNKDELNGSMKDTFGEESSDITEFMAVYKQWKEMKK